MKAMERVPLWHASKQLKANEHEFQDIVCVITIAHESKQNIIVFKNNNACDTHRFKCKHGSVRKMNNTIAVEGAVTQKFIQANSTYVTCCCVLTNTCLTQLVWALWILGSTA